jgi:hypothetical protein
MESTSFSSVSSPASSDAEYDTQEASTDTDLTTPEEEEEEEEEEEWEFQMTPDIKRRLSLLPQHKSGASLPNLPTELQLEVFSHLDQIDSCCLGLTSRNSYLMFRALHGTKMPLNTRRTGPNELEKAWELDTKQECKQCGAYRCELHVHIKSWMPKELEYCSFKGNFGSAADNGAKASCYRGKPSKPKRCGRHPLRTQSVHQDDSALLQEKIGSTWSFAGLA